MASPLSDSEFEQAYDLLAEAIDRAGLAHEAAFLSRLCLLLIEDARNLDAVRKAIAAAEAAAGESD